MSIDGDKYVDVSFSQKNTLILQHVDRAPDSQAPIGPRKPKKTRLKWLPLNETTTAMLRAIKKMRVERLHEYFEQTCDRRPHEPAVICGSSQLTYLELDQRANRLAHFLISHGIGEGNPVGVLLERSLDTYIALLGVIKAGAAFVPLDPSFSSGQVAFITEDAGLQGLIATCALREKTGTLSCPVLELDKAYEALSVQPATRPLVRVDPASLCYITYTPPGPAHQPVGVAVSHTSIVNFLHVAIPIYGLSCNDQVYQGMSTACGFSFQEIWPTWIAGATLVTGPIASQYLDHGLTEFLMEHKITALCCTPTLLATIERDVPTLRFLLLCGAACPSYLVSRWSRPGRHMFNTYGPTETTIAATCHELFPNRPPTLGSPLPTYQIYILDDQLYPVKDGEIGELFIGGPGVAIGYLNRPELTKERFIANPISRDREMVPRLYRTGDLGRLTPAGEIEYLGCIDIQAKSRVYRTEPGEIEQIGLHLVNTVPLNGHASASPPITRAFPEREAEISKLKVANRLNLKNVYMQVLTDPLYRNSIFNMASTFILGGLGFVFWIIIARLYKPENVGIATTLISIMTLLSNFTILGLNVSLNRYLPKSANKNELINSSFIIVTIITLLICAIFFLGLQIFSPQLLFLRSKTLYIISFSVFVIFCSLNMLVDSIFMAFRAASNILIKNSIISILKLILPFALIAFGAYGIFTSTAAAIALGVLIGFIILLLHFKIRPSISVNVALIKETSSYSFANYIVGFMFNMPSQVLPVIILNTLSAKYAAYYYVASMIQNILQVIPTATAQALLTEGSYNEAELKKHVKKAIVTTLIILIPVTGIIIFAGNILLQFFGKSYASESLQFLQLYSISTLFIALLLISNAIMNVKHQIKSLIVSNTIAAILTLGLSYAFISNKLVGIGWGWTLGQAIVGGISLFFIIRNYSGSTSTPRRDRASRELHYKASESKKQSQYYS